MIRILFSSVIGMTLLLTTGQRLSVEQFRGRNRDGVYPETGLLKQWPAEGPKLLWSAEGIGIGYGSPTVTDDRLFINGDIDSLAYLFAYELNGILIWKREFGQNFSVHHGGPRSTPTVTDGLVYVTSGMGDVACFDAEDGDLKWRLNMITDLHGTNCLHGYAQSPLIDDNYLYCQPGGKDTNFVALNRLTGKIKWVSSGSGQVESFSSPILINHKGQKQVVALSEHALYGLDARTGERKWLYDLDTTGFVHANMPIYQNGNLYYVAGTSASVSGRLRLSDDGNHVEEVWHNRFFDNCMGGVVSLDGHLVATGHRQGWLKCLDAERGIVTDSVKLSRGATIYADSMFYLYTEKGIVNLVAWTDGKLKPVSSFTVTLGNNEHYAHPVIRNGVLYIRHGDALMAYAIGAKDGLTIH